MFARINSMGLFGLDSYMVGVEVDYGQGLPRVDLVGLPDTAVNENNNQPFPRGYPQGRSCL